VVTNWMPLPLLDEWSKPGKTFTRWCLGPNEPTRFILPVLLGLGAEADNSGIHLLLAVSLTKHKH